jgi:parallel beta-helix repeat protein
MLLSLAMATTLACNVSSLVPTGPDEPAAISIVVLPGSAELVPTQTVRFFADVRDATGKPVSAPVSWDAGGGTIDANGVYVAGSTAGEYVVRAASLGRQVGEARIKINQGDDKPQTQGAVASVTVSPGSASLAPGQTATFTATARDAQGQPVSASFTWTAAGGTISSSGTFTAGSQAGSFTVRASTGSASGTATVQISSASAPSGVPIPVGSSIQSYVDSHPDGTTFVLRSGVHHGQRIKPKTGQVFVGEPGAILDGDGADFAFRGTAANITIRNLIIEDYAPGAQMGAIKGGGHSREESTEGWTIEGCEIRYNEGGGIRTGNRMRVLNNKVHHNSQIGMVGMGDGLLVEGNEIAYNNWEKKFAYGWEAGGTKFVRTDGLIVRNNWSHHNWGPGLWTDIDNINVTYEGNLVEDNADSGIFHEISYRGVIRNNTVRRNGYDRAGDWAYGAGILVAHSPDVEVHGNVLENNMNGIMAIQQDRGSGGYGPHRLDNLYVHDNQITQQSGNWAAGTAQDVGDMGVFSRNLRFDRNTYTLSGDNRWFEWNNGEHRASTWRSFGMDAGGSFTF